MKFKIGQIVHAQRNLTGIDPIDGEIVDIPKGTEAIVGADGYVHVYDLNLDKILDGEIQGLDTKGLAYFLVTYLQRELKIKSWEVPYSKMMFIKKIARGLEELGL